MKREKGGKEVEAAKTPTMATEGPCGSLKGCRGYNGSVLSMREKQLKREIKGEGKEKERWWHRGCQTVSD